MHRVALLPSARIVPLQFVGSSETARVMMHDARTRLDAYSSLLASYGHPHSIPILVTCPDPIYQYYEPTIPLTAASLSRSTYRPASAQCPASTALRSVQRAHTKCRAITLAQRPNSRRETRALSIRHPSLTQLETTHRSAYPPSLFHPLKY